MLQLCSFCLPFPAPFSTFDHPFLVVTTKTMQMQTHHFLISQSQDNLFYAWSHILSLEFRSILFCSHYSRKDKSNLNVCLLRGSPSLEEQEIHKSQRGFAILSCKWIIGLQDWLLCNTSLVIVVCVYLFWRKDFETDALHLHHFKLKWHLGQAALYSGHSG